MTSLKLLYYVFNDYKVQKQTKDVAFQKWVDEKAKMFFSEKSSDLLKKTLI